MKQWKRRKRLKNSVLGWLWIKVVLNIWQTLSRNLQNIGGCLLTCKKVFLCFLFFGALVLFSLLVFFLGGQAPKRLFSCNFRGSSSFVPPVGLSLRSFSSSYSFIFLVFLVSPVSKFHIFLCCLSINPFLKTFLVSSIFLLLPFPLLMFACLFKRNFPNVPFSRPTCFHVWLFLFCSSVAFVYAFMFHVSVFMFSVGIVFGMLFFCFCFVFLLCFWLLLSDYEKTLFSLQF